MHFFFPFKKLKYIAISPFGRFAILPFYLLNWPQGSCGGCIEILLVELLANWIKQIFFSAPSKM